MEDKAHRKVHIDPQKGNDLLGDGSEAKPFKTIRGYHTAIRKGRIKGEHQVSLSGSFTGKELNAIFGQRKPNRAERRAASRRS